MEYWSTWLLPRRGNRTKPGAPGLGLKTRSAFGVRRSAFVLVLVLVLVLERCCLQKRRVNPIGSAKSELHPRSGVGGAEGPFGAETECSTSPQS